MNTICPPRDLQNKHTVTRPLALTALAIALLFLAFPLIPAIRARREKLIE